MEVINMFPVEVGIQESDGLMAKMAVMRQWLDHRHVEPLAFRYAFTSPGIVFRVDFRDEAEAAAFAKEFDGWVFNEPSFAKGGRQNDENRVMT